MMKKAVGYIRVSTEGQAGDDKFGIDAQKAEIMKYAAENGYDIVKWYTDEMSGASDDRPELSKILYGDEVDNPPYEAVIVYKNDRVARDTKLYFYYLYTLEKKNVKLISTQESFAEGSEFANIYRALLQFVAEQERKNIAARTGNGRKIKSAAGGYCGGNLPYGYKSVDGKMVVKEEEAEMVRIVFAMRAENVSMSRIACKINDLGYRTRKGGYFSMSNVQSILNNEKTYRGFYHYGDKHGEPIHWVKGIHEPILK